MTSREPNPKHKLLCPSCKTRHVIQSAQPPVFCPHCGYKFSSYLSSTEESLKGNSESEEASISFIQGHEPSQESVLFAIGPYKIYKSIGKGGMGEVLLAYDTTCGRRIALKRIRPDLLSFRHIQNRFLKEARVTSQLTHPAIIPIYAIHQEEQFAYYTMPFVEGKTLKQILKTSRQIEKNGGKTELAGGSIPALLRIFLSICQAVAYAHSKSILHRDLKPENMIIGQYGEVMILDWGLAKHISSEENSELEDQGLSHPLHHMTQIGKVVGTVGYMAPERALGKPADKKTDIYSLGIILYQILTLRLPFKRGSLKEFRESMSQEVLIDPIVAAPYRDIPKVLSQIAIKCLSPDPDQRFETIDLLIHDLENYLEGRAEWFQTAELHINKKSDWEFQEHILIAEHTAITRTAEISEWVHLMISKASFAENIKIETKVLLHENCQGIGLLFNVPEKSEREHINEGYCLWLSSDLTKNSRLLHSSVEVLAWPDIYLSRNQWHSIRLEKADNTLRIWIDNEEQLSYISRKPFAGTHIGILTRDSNYTLEPIHIFVSSQNVMVNCLAVPDALLAHKHYQQALSEYRRIGYSFSGRAEGREAVLRAGVTLIEQGKDTASKKEAETLYDAALEEFAKLNRTAGAPLEYLGKALVYEAQKDIEEEVKCFELAYRKYPHHPLLHTLQEQMLFRLMQSSRTDRREAYHFLLLAYSHVPDFSQYPPLHKLISYLKKHWETPDFLLPDANNEKYDMVIPLAFWLHKNYALEEATRTLISEENSMNKSLLNGFFCLIALNENNLAQKLFDELPKSRFRKEKKILLPLLNSDIETGLKEIVQQSILAQYPNPLGILLDKAIDQKNTKLFQQAYAHLPASLQEQFISKKIWALLLDHNFQEVGQLFEKIPFDLLTKDTSIMHFLYGCWLSGTETMEIAQIHWNSVLEIPFPPTWALGTHYIAGKLDTGWFKKAFDWERWQLQRQLELFNSLQNSHHQSH